ncbi:unnamed protein product [Caenorhabditis bovis]|uniref:NR LBD domain-containing protein n=1 Tax=Caenorhabditis bovis TaxID=2654633 RepID=A0A8S1F1X3_9PELO|nr:unnamed protein product [Caenorhabditis bovis]
MDNNNGVKNIKIEEQNERAMMIISQHNLRISTENSYRFPSKQFGYIFHNSTPFVLQNPDEILRKLIPLENYCYAADSGSGLSLPMMNDNVDLFQALFFPNTLAPRTAIAGNRTEALDENNLRFMWLRMVAFYFEWVTGITEIRYLSDSDKLKLVVHQLCKVICFAIAFNNHKTRDEFERENVLNFGSGFFWTPKSSQDPLINEYSKRIWTSINVHLMPLFQKIQITTEEYLFSKMLILFDCSTFTGLSAEGLGFVQSMENKYRTILANYLLVKYSDHDEKQKQALVLERLETISRLVQSANVPLKICLIRTLHICSFWSLCFVLYQQKVKCPDSLVAQFVATNSVTQRTSNWIAFRGGTWKKSNSAKDPYFRRSAKWVRNMNPSGGTLVTGRGGFRPGFHSDDWRSSILAEPNFSKRSLFYYFEK